MKVRTTKKTSERHKKQSAVFNMKQDNEYQAEFSLGPNVVQYLEFKLDKAECKNLTYDEVETKAYDEAEKMWPVDSFPNLELKQIRIHCTDADEWCDVFSESMKKEIAECEKSSETTRFLVLPDATYFLTPECKLWISMKEEGVIPEYAEFDFYKMSRILETINKKVD